MMHKCIVAHDGEKIVDEVTTRRWQLTNSKIFEEPATKNLGTIMVSPFDL